MSNEVCVICEEEIKADPVSGWAGGNNPFPVREEGRCCDNCNSLFVIPARMANIFKKGGSHE